MQHKSPPGIPRRTGFCVLPHAEMFAYPPAIIHKTATPPLLGHGYIPLSNSSAGQSVPPISPTAAVLLEDVLKTCSISFIGIVMQFHVGVSAVECYSICPYYAGKTQCKPWHSTAQDGTPWCQMQRDSTLFQMAGTIPVHQCCIPLHRRTHSAILQNGLPHGLMQAHRERHTPTSRKRGALLEQYNPLSEHGNR